MATNLRVTAIQMDIVWENPTTNQSQIEKLLPAEDTSDIVILPEMFSTGFTPNGKLVAETMNGSTVRWMIKSAAEMNYAIAGSLVIQENGEIYNRFVWANPNGEVVKYDKRHLFTYGKEHLHYTQGDKRVIINYAGWRILPQICYDLRFPVWSRNCNDYDLAIYVASWPATRIWIWDHLLVARAIENQASIIGVNRVGTDGMGLEYSGHSQIINPKGEIIQKSKIQGEENINAILDYEMVQNWRSFFPALEDRDSFLISQ